MIYFFTALSLEGHHRVPSLVDHDLMRFDAFRMEVIEIRWAGPFACVASNCMWMLDRWPIWRVAQTRCKSMIDQLKDGQEIALSVTTNEKPAKMQAFKIAHQSANEQSAERRC